MGDRRSLELGRCEVVSTTDGSLAGAANTVDEEEEEEGVDPAVLGVDPEGA